MRFIANIICKQFGIWYDDGSVNRNMSP